MTPNDPKLALLQAALNVSVPLYIDQLSRRPWSYVRSRASACADVVASKGDVILYRSKKQGETANAFNHLAEGIACGAFAVGGVTVLGLHFEAKHPEQDRVNDSDNV